MVAQYTRCVTETTVAVTLGRPTVCPPRPFWRLPWLVLGALAACPAAPAPPAPEGPTVEAHSDSASVTAMTATPRYLFAGTDDGLDRWDLRDDSVRRLGVTDGLPGTVVRALDARGDLVWVLTDAGVARLRAGDLVVELAAAPPTVAGAPAILSALAPDGAGGAWVGGRAGLWHVDATGTWLGGGWTRPVNALWQDAHGELFLGTREGLEVRHADGSFGDIGAAEGCAATSVRFFVTAPDGAPLAVGEAADGSPVIAFRIGETWKSYRPSPALTFVAGTRRGEAVVLASADRLWELTPPHAGARTLRRDGAHLVPLAGADRSPYAAHPSDASLPPDVRALASSGDEIFVGTAGVGTARYAGAATRPAWLRHRDLAAGGSHLSVTCPSKRSCFAATGGRTLWRYDGNGFHAIEIDKNVTRVLAAVRGKDGAIYALYLLGSDSKLHVARLDAGVFRPTFALAIESPGPLAALSFARFSPDGILWVGLEYTDKDGETEPYGVATIELDLGVVTYHRQELGNYSKKTGILPVPNDVADVAFDPGDAEEKLDVWFATASGAAHMSLPGEKLELYTENEGLDSEILHGIAVSSGGVVYVASMHGVGTFDGEHWTFPRALRLVANAIAVSSDGRLWIGTDRGVVVYDGRRGQRVVARAGLLSEAIEDLQDDGQGRIWTLSAQGIGIITP
jgi:hypothetical protein